MWYVYLRVSTSATTAHYPFPTPTPTHPVPVSNGNAPQQSFPALATSFPAPTLVSAFSFLLWYGWLVFLHILKYLFLPFRVLRSLLARNNHCHHLPEPLLSQVILFTLLRSSHLWSETQLSNIILYLRCRIIQMLFFTFQLLATIHRRMLFVRTEPRPHPSVPPIPARTRPRRPSFRQLLCSNRRMPSR